MIARQRPPIINRRRWLLIAATSLIALVFSSATITAFYVFNYGQGLIEPLPAANSADLIIILGAGTNRDGLPSEAHTRRVRHGVALYKRGVAPYILCTGGRDGVGYAKSEAESCVELATAQSVPAEAILREDLSHNTEQNIIQAKRVMTAHNLTTAVIVSDSYHLFRAEHLADRYNLSVTAYSPAQATQGALPFVEGTISCYREVGALIWNIIRRGQEN